jgi:hypothetical protein
MTATRRLAAILAADVAAYSRLIGADEEGTLNRLRSIRADLIDPKITEHRGRIVKTTVMACWSNFPVWLMPCVVRPNGSTGWMSEVPLHRAIIASSSVSVSTRATSLSRTTISSGTG